MCDYLHGFDSGLLGDEVRAGSPAAKVVTLALELKVDLPTFAAFVPRDTAGFRYRCFGRCGLLARLATILRFLFLLFLFLIYSLST